MNTLDDVRKAPSCKTMGIEIECCVPRDFPNAYGFRGFFYGGSDGSIDCEWGSNMRGVEYVSQPLTYEWMHRELNKLFKTLPSSIEYNQSCGIHVHVSKKWCSEKKAHAIYAFIRALELNVLIYVFGRKPNTYCGIESVKLNSRYLAINIENKATTEFRMFKSGGLAWSKYCIDCAKYLTENAFHLNVDALLAFRDCYKDI